MNRLFISHSTQDLEDLQPFIEFLQLGMGIAKDDIFWTSSAASCPPGNPSWSAFGAPCATASRSSAS